MEFWPVKDKRADGADFIVIGYDEPPDIFEIDLNKYPPRAGQVIPNTNTYDLGAAWKKLVRRANPICRSSWTARHCGSLSSVRSSSRILSPDMETGEEEAEQAAA